MLIYLAMIRNGHGFLAQLFRTFGYLGNFAETVQKRPLAVDVEVTELDGLLRHHAAVPRYLSTASTLFSYQPKVTRHGGRHSLTPHPGLSQDQSSQGTRCSGGGRLSPYPPAAATCS